MQHPYVKWALIAATFTIILRLTTYLVNPSMVDGFLVSFTSLAVSLYCFVKLALEERSLQGGFIAFGQVFKVLIFGMGIYFALVYFFDMILKSSIAPELVDEQIKVATEMLEKVSDFTGEEISNEDFEELKKRAQPGIKTFLINFFTAMLCAGGVVGTIISLIVQRKDKNQELL